MASIGQRIAEIRSLVADPSLAVSRAVTSTASRDLFAAALADALSVDGTANPLATPVRYDPSGGPGSPGVSSASLLGALGPAGVSPAPAAARPTSSTALTADGVPADLASYGNGRIPRSALEPVGATGASMWAPAAQSLGRLIAAAKADGVSIGVTEGYRSYDEQVTLARTKGLYSAGGLAAAPGTSEHGWGMAADLELDPSALAWMREHSSEYGFYATAPRESWHWGYRPSA
jgi:hypothetical protein